MRKFDKSKWGLVVLLTLSLFNESKAQFSLTGQIRTRTEIRDGLGNLPGIGIHIASFTPQQSCPAFEYQWDCLNLKSLDVISVAYYNSKLITPFKPNRLVLTNFRKMALGHI
jgi:hypothetical protein